VSPKIWQLTTLIRHAVERDPRFVLGAESRTLHQILEAKMESEAETNAQCGRIADKAAVSGTCFPAGQGEAHRC
jgi:hypothetical protein